MLRLASSRLLFIRIHLEDCRPAMSHKKADVACLESVAYNCDCFVEASLHTSRQCSCCTTAFSTSVGRAGVPMEVMGLMLGEFVDDYTVKVVDVFAMPQSGTGVSVEAVDPVFQTKMLDMLKQCGRSVLRLQFVSLCCMKGTPMLYAAPQHCHIGEQDLCCAH